MALIPTSGQFSMGDINVELGLTRTTANTSLAGGVTPVSTSQFGRANSSRNKVAPHAMSEFRGYLNKAVVFSQARSLTSSGGILNGTVTVTGGPAVFRAFATCFTVGSDVATNISVNGSLRGASRTTQGTTSSSGITLAVGTYNYSFEVSINSGTGSGGISFTQA